MQQIRHRAGQRKEGGGCTGGKGGEVIDVWTDMLWDECMSASLGSPSVIFLRCISSMKH